MDPTETRSWVGVRDGMTPAEFEDSTLRWWPPVCTQMAVNAGYLFVVNGGFIVGVNRIDDWHIAPGAAKGRFSGGAVAMWRGHITTGHLDVIDPTDPIAADLSDIIGTPAPGGGGGSITPWNP